MKKSGFKGWRQYCKSGKKPDDIPSHPAGTYKKEWKGWGDWLGTGTIASFDREYRSFAEARKSVHNLKLKNSDEWGEYAKSDRKPSDIPADPSWQYDNEWKGMGDWLGTGFIAARFRQYLPFEEAKNLIHSFHLKGQDEWNDYCRSGKKPQNIPANPPEVYDEDWNSWPDWLGYEERDWSIKKSKGIIKRLNRKQNNLSMG